VEPRVPDIVTIEAVDENVSAEVEEVYSGSGNRHLRSTLSEDRWRLWDAVVLRRGSVVSRERERAAKIGRRGRRFGLVRTRGKVVGEFDNSDLLNVN